MNNNQYTPGPWKQMANMVSSPDNGFVCIVGRVHTTNETVTYERLQLGDSDWDEAMANARLIEQAPALLEACKMLVGASKKAEHDLSLDDPANEDAYSLNEDAYSLLCAATDAAQAAIAAIDEK